MVRPGSLIAVGANDLRPDYDYADGVALHLFELGDGETASVSVCNAKGEHELEVKVTRQGGKMTVTAEGADKPWELILRGIQQVRTVRGGTSSEGSMGLRILAEPGVRSMEIEL
ncbi:Alpha-xylosidase [compost metagenome]